MIPEQKSRLIDRLAAPFQRFVQLETSGGIVLLLCAVVAMLWINGPSPESYVNFWKTYAGISVGDWSLKLSLGHWINDALMAIFFFLVGLEIKHEVVDGELKSARAAMLPIMAALGGMVVPAAIYVAFNAGQPTINGWGIAMATDIAFALGVLKLLGRRVPAQLKLILMALAIVDDMGAVIVIALFYSGAVQTSALLSALAVWGLMLLLSRAGVKRLLPYFFLSVFVWYFVLRSGVHATVAGVIAALAIPAKAEFTVSSLIERAREMLAETPEDSEAYDEEIAQYVGEMAAKVQSPLQRAIDYLHPWVAFLIMPVFALANGGVVFSAAEVGEALRSPVGLGVLFGLVVGKQVGVTLFVWLALKMKLTVLPEGLTLKHVSAMAWLAGIGFTMSLFINSLAFTDLQHIAQAKIAILLASLIAGVSGAFAFVRMNAKEPTQKYA